MSDGHGRVFLFLQGPHGPFVRRLAARLAASGAAVRRVAFNAADEAEWGGAGPFDRYAGGFQGYSDWLSRYFDRHGITDVVLYGDSRPEHAMAVAVAWQRGVLCHCLEEGYLRPHWVTYERWGNNGNSPLTGIPLDAMAAVVGSAAPEGAPPPDGWGAQRPHLWYSALYHAQLLMPSGHYGRHGSRRGMSLWREAGNYVRRAASLPLRRVLHRRRMHRLLTGGRPYHLVLLQLSFDASMQSFSGYRSSAEFVAECIAAFARGAPPDDILAFKTHPFEDGRERLGRVIAHEGTRHGVSGRLVFLDGGPGLGPLLDSARSAVTINSTGAQQALCRALPVAALGRAVYARPKLVSQKPLEQFFAGPERPDRQAYGQFRRFLLMTSQIEGSFYSEAGIAATLERLPAKMLALADPYERALAGTAGRASRHRSAPAPAAEARHEPDRRRLAG